MGCEVFEVVLRAAVTVPSVEQVVVQLAALGARPRQPAPATTGVWYEVRLDYGIVEFVLNEDGCIWCQFALCSPERLDSAYVSMVTTLALNLGMRAEVPGLDVAIDAEPEQRLRTQVLAAIASSRVVWDADWGSRRAVLPADEALGYFVRLSELK